jgi:hypothetical protein
MHQVSHLIGYAPGERYIWKDITGYAPGERQDPYYYKDYPHAGNNIGGKMYVMHQR